MAIRDEIRHQQKRLKGKGVKAHVSYFFTYYTWHTIGAICAVIAVIMLVRTFLARREQVFGAIFLNASTTVIGNEDYGQELEEGFSSYIDLDTGKYQAVVDTSAYQTPGIVVDTYDMTTSEKVGVQSIAGALDCLVADASNFYYYTCSLAMVDLREILSAEELAQYESYIYYVDMADVDAYQEAVNSAEGAGSLMTKEEGAANEKVDAFTMPDPDKMQEPTPVGIVVTDAPKIADSGVYTDRVAIFGFTQNSTHQENAVRFLTYLFEE